MGYSNGCTVALRNEEGLMKLREMRDVGGWKFVEDH